MTNILANKEHLNGLRIADLLAKSAGVTMKDTARVLLTLSVVCDFLNIAPDDVLALEHENERASELEALACEKAYAELRQHCKHVGAEGYLRRIKYYELDKLVKPQSMQRAHITTCSDKH